MADLHWTHTPLTNHLISNLPTTDLHTNLPLLTTQPIAIKQE
jgi:hypothetical protein